MMDPIGLNLETLVTKSSAALVTYEATTPGFSYFAIRVNVQATASEIDTTTETEENAINGNVSETTKGAYDIKKDTSKVSWKKVGLWFLLILVLVGLGIGLYLFIKKRELKALFKSSKLKK